MEPSHTLCPVHHVDGRPTPKHLRQCGPNPSELCTLGHKYNKPPFYIPQKDSLHEMEKILKQAQQLYLFVLTNSVSKEKRYNPNNMKGKIKIIGPNYACYEKCTVRISLYQGTQKNITASLREKIRWMQDELTRAILQEASLNDGI